ncbi:hypothetical protein [Acidaminococcus massiliensis]|uniref:hypothetical protein n=1 Tax=Acidaminococcus massiliensis TaxID=1852375 RepID=UPI0035212390
MENSAGCSVSLWQKIVSFLLVIFPILDIYSVGIKGIGIGSIILCFILIGMGIRFLTLNRSIKLNPYYGFFLYGLCISLLTVLIHNDFSITAVAIRMTYFLFYTLLIFLPSSYDFDIHFAEQIYLKIGMAAGAFLILQYFSFWGLRYNLIGLIPGLPLNYAIEDYVEWMDAYNNMYTIMFRPTSFFPEPAAFTQYMAPLLILVLFTNVGEKKKLLKAAFISIVMILSTSTNGIVFSLFIWILYFVYINHDSLKNRRFPIFLVPLFLFAIVFAILILFTDNTISDYTVQQFEGLFSKNQSSSAYLRIMRGFDIYRQLNFFENILGIGLGTYKSYYATGVLTVYDGETEYMNSLSYLFVSTGVIGVLLFIYSLFYNVPRRSMASHALAFLILLSFFSSSLFNSPTYALSYLFLLHLDSIKNSGD